MENHPASNRAALTLEANRIRLIATAEKLGKPTHEPMENWSETIDLAQAAAARDTSEALRNLLDALQQDVAHALARLEIGGYGICEDCSQPISIERLRAVPEATRCLNCQRRRNS